MIGHAPRSDRTRDLARKLDQQGRRLEFLRRYLGLYQEYAQAELQFSDTNTLALYRSLSEEDQETFAFDTAVVDWKVYLQDIHCPAVTAPIRRLDEVRAARKRPSAPAQKALVEKPGVAAFFDMDGTLLSSNVIETYLWLRLRELSGTERFAELSRIAAKVPSLVQAERRERSAFLRSVYREYDGARLADLDAIADEHLTDHVLTRLSPAAVRKIREHRAAGHRTVLITGAIRPLTRPLIPLFDHIEAAELAVDDRGVCTGYLASSPLVGESRAAWMQQYAADHGIDLTASYGYADSHSDLPLLEAVGRPVAVRPDVPLFRHARKARWTIVDWQSSTSNTRTLNPAGGSPMMLALEMFRSRAADRGRQGDRRPDARHPVRVRRAAAAGDDRRAEGRPARLGAAAAPGCPGSAAPTWACCRAGPASTSRPWCRCRSCPATRWSPSCSTTARTCRPAPASSSTRC